MPITLNSLTLPDLHWEDEFDFAPVVQGLSRTEAGVLVREESPLVAGRPVTLVGGDNYAWARRELVLSLAALQSTANAAPMTLTLADARSFAVVWRRDGNTPAMSARPVQGPLSELEATDYYSLSLRLVTV